jgi:hypothetical protein
MRVWIRKSVGLLLLFLHTGSIVQGGGFTAQIGSMAWSPDGRRIAFKSHDSDEKREDVTVVNVDGTEAVTVYSLSWK